ncbi:MAG: hypothetical protein GY828_03490, partial [Candidatus Gracilibacteria bacterium]|nr:hypothetical protein [Candidatus Gracilibacteria bacterium]
MKQKKIYIIGIGGIGISAIARYYNQMGYLVYGSDSTDSELIQTLIGEGIHIFIGERPDFITPDITQVIYTEAVPISQSELSNAIDQSIPTFTYPESLANIANVKKLIAISGTHGKSTTTSFTSILMKNSSHNINAVIGTLLKEFGGKNAYFSESDYFAIEACEYKRSFLQYHPYIAVITNIEIDHLDYYKDLDDYISAYEEFISHVQPGGYVILNGDDSNCKKLLGKRTDLKYIEIYSNFYIYGGEKILFSDLSLQIPGSHILFDAHIAYVIGKIVGIPEKEIVLSLEAYNGVWRRMEQVGITQSNNILLSDYGHHPTEVQLTLDSIQQKYPDKKILTLFQPHQYNRTIELIDGFVDSFTKTD